MKKNIYFATKNIGKRFKYEEFLKIPKRKLIDFVCRIQAGSTSDERILATWEDHFRGLKIPYCITQHGNVKTLWKERVV